MEGRKEERRGWRQEAVRRKGIINMEIKEELSPWQHRETSEIAASCGVERKERHLCTMIDNRKKHR